jgi:hypothetical protein
MIDFSQVKEGMRIGFTGDSWAFGGDYGVHTIESTYINPDDVPEDKRGKLCIVEFMNDDTPMFFTLDMLNPNVWKIVEENK